MICVHSDCESEAVNLHYIQNLSEYYPSENVPNSRDYFSFLKSDDFVMGSILLNSQYKHKKPEAFVRAGPREVLHFDPEKVRAAVVTCGGLCPGLNDVIREVTLSLLNHYKVEHVLGIRGGFNGMTTSDFSVISLSADVVKDCHHQGGSILGSSRGGFDIPKMLDFLSHHRVNQLYIIGGDGTHRGANALSQAITERKLNIAVIGIPKTIDNDVDLIDRSFGFQTSVEAAQHAISSAKTEARCNLPNGIGIVKLMGRSSGFIASYAALGFGDIDLCLVPEIPITEEHLRGPGGYLSFLLNRVAEKGHAVVVVAEGAGEDLLGRSLDVDKGGNRKLPKIGEFIKKEIEEYFADHKVTSNVKYIDPSYMIRSVPANASDSMFCMILAQNAVHGAMAGFTAFSVGLVNNRIVYIPISRIVENSPRMMNSRGHTWQRVLSMTMQPKLPATE